MVYNSGHGLNNNLKSCYSDHDDGLTNKLLLGIWILNKEKFVIQMFLIQISTVLNFI